MSKEVRFSSDARKAMLKGVNVLGDAVCVTLGPKEMLYWKKVMVLH